MANFDRLRPLHHTTCDYPISGMAELSSIRVVMTEHGILDSLVDYFLAPANRGKSPSWRMSVARSVGYFYDFSVQARPLYESKPSPTAFLSDFAYHLLAGTVDADGLDELGLYWPKQPFGTVNQYIKNLTSFSDYCESKHGAKAANPWRKSLSFSEQLAQFRAWDRRNKESLLHHTGSRKQSWHESSKVRSFSLKGGPKIEEGGAIAFPEDRFDELITSGFAQHGRSVRRSLIEGIQIRDVMIAVLQRGAGFRESEPFHLYVDDVWENPNTPGSALVRIHHPSEGKVSEFDPVTERNVFINRMNYLKSLGYSPRHLIQGKERAGWKDPLLIRDKATKTLYIEAYWFPQGYGELFWQLYKAYMAIRPKTAHPFLFVTDRGKNAGEPYRIDQYNNKLQRAVERIGLNFGKSFGTTSHGFRHRYGQDLRVKAGLERSVRQKLMHHKNPNSTDVYAEPLEREIHDRLSAAQENMHIGNYPPLGGALMTNSIFSSTPAIEVSDGIYRSPDQNLFAIPRKIDWTGVAFECDEFVRRYAEKKCPKWLLDGALLIGKSRTSDELQTQVERFVERIKPNTMNSGHTLALLINLWKAGAIVFPPACISNNDTELSRLSGNFKLISYLSEIEERNGQVDELISGLRKKRRIREISLNRILRRSVKGLLTLAPIREIQELSEDTISLLIQDAGDARGKEFAYIGLAYFNNPHVRYQHVLEDMKSFFDPIAIDKEDLKRSSPTCKWVLPKDPTLEEWRSAIEEFLETKRQLKGLSGHLSAIQQLLKYLLEYPDLPREVLTFLHRKHNPEVTITDFLLGQNLSRQTQGHYLSKLSEFFDWYLDEYCAEPSEEDGLPVRLPEFQNPIDPSDIPMQAARLGQTHRVAMPYRYVEICKEIIIRNDFEWPKTLDADYFSAIQDETGNRIKVWSPVRAYALLFKFLLPLRTHQVRMLESGEGDCENYDYVTGQWRDNQIDTKLRKKPSGFIRKIWDGQRGGHMTGMFINTNKTKTRDAVDEGYVIPWQNDEVINLAARLQEWQVEHDPLDRPTAFADIVPALGDLPTKDVIASTPDRYYLFRDPCGKFPEAPVTTGRLKLFFLRLMEKLEEELWDRKITNADGSKIAIITTRDKWGKPTASLFDLHSLRVTGLTAFVKAGVPIHILSKLVAGHSTFLMTLYYAQMDIGYVTDILSEAQIKIEDNAGTELAQALKNMEMSEIRRITAHNSIAGVSAINSSDSGLWSWMDWGICPVNSQKCDEGGEPVQDNSDRNYFGPVKGGAGNCPLCRFFITGPQFLLGLVAKFNETILAMSEKGKFLREKRDQRQKLMAERRSYERGGMDFPKERELARATSAYETLLAEVNTTAETLHALYGLIEQSKAISEQQRKVGKSDDKLPLIKAPQCDVSFSEASEWEAQDEVCRSARFFDSINWRNANLRRSNAFNLMMQRNGMSPVFIGLSDEASKAALDDLTDLMMKRLKRDEVRQLMEGETLMSELGIRDEIKLAIEESVGHSVDLLDGANSPVALPSPSPSSRSNLNGS